MSDDNLPVSIGSGEFTLFGVTLHCHVLSNGQRIIEAGDVYRLFDAMGRDDAALADDVTGALEEFARWMKGR